jgi:hypothetical protein
MTNFDGKIKGDLIELLKLSGGLIAVVNGLWLLAVEEVFGNAEAVRLDIQVWKRYAHAFVKRIRNGLGLSGSDVDGIRELIELDPMLLMSEYEISHLSKDRLFLRVNRCSLQEAITRSGGTEFVCTSSTRLHFRNIAREVDPKVTVHSIKLPPRGSPDGACCERLFEMREKQCKS